MAIATMCPPADARGFGIIAQATSRAHGPQGCSELTNAASAENSEEGGWLQEILSPPVHCFVRSYTGYCGYELPVHHAMCATRDRAEVSTSFFFLVNFRWIINLTWIQYS